MAKIEWTDRTISPIRWKLRSDADKIAAAKGYTSLLPVIQYVQTRIGADRHSGTGQHCEAVSPGCKNCYACSNSKRLLPANGLGLPYDRRARDLVDPFIDEAALRRVVVTRNSKRWFVQNQSDLFAEFIPDHFRHRVHAAMMLAPRQTFQVLTKRSAAARAYYSDRRNLAEIIKEAIDLAQQHLPAWSITYKDVEDKLDGFYLHNVWLGVSVEDDARANLRLGDLVQTPAAVRFVSYEPALGPVNWRQWLGSGMIDWVIMGGESGHLARPANIAWFGETIELCRELGVAAFVKQLGRRSFGWPLLSQRPKHRSGANPKEWPEPLRVRQFPHSEALRVL